MVGIALCDLHLPFFKMRDWDRFLIHSKKQHRSSIQIDDAAQFVQVQEKDDVPKLITTCLLQNLAFWDGS